MNSNNDNIIDYSDISALRLLNIYKHLIGINTLEHNDGNPVISQPTFLLNNDVPFTDIIDEELIQEASKYEDLDIINNENDLYLFAMYKSISYSLICEFTIFTDVTTNENGILEVKFPYVIDEIINGIIFISRNGVNSLYGLFSSQSEEFNSTGLTINSNYTNTTLSVNLYIKGIIKGE